MKKLILFSSIFLICSSALASDSYTFFYERLSGTHEEQARYCDNAAARMEAILLKAVQDWGMSKESFSVSTKLSFGTCNPNGCPTTWGCRVILQSLTPELTFVEFSTPARKGAHRAEACQADYREALATRHLFQIGVYNWGGGLFGSKKCAVSGVEVRRVAD